MREPISPELRDKILKRDKYACRYCGSKNSPFHLDHVYPVVRGGETSFENLVTSCVPCNQKKHSSVGMWPKPIGYFEDRKTVSFISILVLIIGITFSGTGFMMSLDYEPLGQIFMLIGVSATLIATGRIVLEAS